jgi:glycosidase
MREPEHPWWQRGVVYQVYPRSFQDASGDGVGDLRGIVGRLDHLGWLGVNAVWISPFYPSPMADFGYDMTDHKNVDSLFGTMEDFDLLVAEAHRRGIRVILDYVPNHTSEEHSWFVASRSSRDDPRRDWYIWADPAPDGGPPNNWIDAFGGGSAWKLDESTGQYYYHAHLAEQPDLNWRNEEVRDAMLDVLRFWLERGVDGFRVDALRHLIKDRELRDNPPNPDHGQGDRPFDALLPVYNTDRPEIHDAIAAMRRVLDGHDAVMIGELYLPIERLVTYYGSGVHLPFNFHLLSTPWNAREVASLVESYEAALPPGAWPNWVLGNHDRSRIASRVGPAQARVAAMLLLTLRGTPTLYYGDEIGMRVVFRQAVHHEPVHSRLAYRHRAARLPRRARNQQKPEARLLRGLRDPFEEHHRHRVGERIGEPVRVQHSHNARPPTPQTPRHGVRSSIPELLGRLEDPGPELGRELVRTVVRVGDRRRRYPYLCRNLLDGRLAPESPRISGVDIHPDRMVSLLKRFSKSF